MQLYASFVEKIWKNDDGTENGDMPLSKYRKLVCFFYAKHLNRIYYNHNHLNPIQSSVLRKPVHFS